MPSFLHELTLLAVRDRPGLTARLLDLAGFGAAVPDSFEPQVQSGDLTEVLPTERRADLVVLLRGPKASLAVIVEVQLRDDPKKRYAWPSYMASVHDRYHCDVVLLVVTPFARVARRVRKGLSLGPGSFIAPAVVGPADVPRITDPEQARAAPEMALLSLIASRNDPLPLAVEVAQAAERGFAELPPELSTKYFDAGRTVIRKAVRAALEELMTASGYQYKSEFARRYVAQGREEGIEKVLPLARQNLVSALTFRFGELPGSRLAALERADLETLTRWSSAVVTAATLDDVFSAE